MPAPTQPVTINIADFGGPSVAGITVTARLDQVDHTADGTFVGTEPVTGVTDVNGQVVLHLFPNAVPPVGLGTVGSVVRVSAPIPNSQPLDVLALVPNAPSNLVNIIAVEDPTGLSAIQQAVRAAIDSRLYPNTYAIAPTTRPDASPIQAGDRYLNTSYQEFRWNGAAWVNIEANAAASAATATTQAGIATAQATQAGLYAALAATGAKFYDTIALGRAGVADTFTFGVKAGGTDNLTHPSVYRREAAGGQTLLYTINTLGDVSAILTAAFGVYNIFDASAIADNQILPNGGAPGAFAGYMVTPFIPVKGGGYVTFNANGATSSWGLQFYDANQTYVSSPGSVVANTPTAIPAGVAYVRASFDKTVITAAKLMAVLGQTMLSEYQPFGMTSPANNLRLARRVASVYRANVKRNLLDFNNLTSGFFIQSGDGSFTANTDWSLTGYIPVTPGGTITVAPSMPSNVGVNWYDYNQTFISVTAGPFTDGQAVAVPSNAFFMRASYLTASLTSPSAVLLLEGTQAHQNAYYHNAVMQSDLRPWLGKGWLVQGTSIDVNVNWFATPAAAHGANLTNVARSSRDSSHNLYLADNVTLLQASDFTNIDMVYLNTFTNDAAASMPIGSSADSAATASVWGYTRNFFETVLGYKPAMRIVLGTPLQRFDGGLGAWPYSKMLAYAQAVRDIGAFWGAPVLDLYNLSGFNKTTALSGAPAALTIDGVHPTTAGYNQGLIKPATAFFYNCLPVA